MTPDPLFDRNWLIIRDAALAASRNDGPAHRRNALRVESDVPVDWRAGVVAGFALRAQLRRRYGPGLLGPNAAVADVDRVVSDHAERLHIVSGAESRMTLSLLCTVLEIEPAESKATGPEVIYFGSALLGLLLEDPESDLFEIESRLGAFYDRNHAHFPEG
jgi:hypothetical protein